MVQTVYKVIFLFMMISCFHGVRTTFTFTEDIVYIRRNSTTTIGFIIANPLNLIEYLNVTVNFLVEDENIIEVTPLSVNITDEIFKSGYIPLTVRGIAPGKSDILTNIIPDQLSSERDAFTIVNVHKNDVIVAISEIMGWIYFVAWSFSFYPQVWTNYFSKSVVGLSFDFVSLNIVGYACYSTFNIGLYAIPAIRAEFSARYPQSLIPVLRNDIIFSVHASCLTIITGIQCLIYESNKQSISNIVKCQHGFIAAVLAVTAVLVSLKCGLWLDFIYMCSYVKLVLTLTKYIPQAYMNYRRKSTVGWNIYNVVADFTGGLFSINQMFLNAHNFDEWESLLQNPTKFWLGIVSICFDVVFLIQHYILYRDKDVAVSDTESILAEENAFIDRNEKLG
ncbi:PQ loop repeat [Popillia japonica]|uniref:PQ loop repeat n=1 Tax=Popillia japonica TaxID=7064 RepID=A0AAW1M017_POPJA